MTETATTPNAVALPAHAMQLKSRLSRMLFIILTSLAAGVACSGVFTVLLFAAVSLGAHWLDLQSNLQESMVFLVGPIAMLSILIFFAVAGSTAAHMRAKYDIKIAKPILCDHCDYDLRATPSGTCPECGTVNHHLAAANE